MSKLQYIVKAGDTLQSICFRQGGVRIQQIATLNHLDLSRPLTEGQTLDIPMPERSYAPPLFPRQKTHTVSYGETLSSIARDYLGDPRRWVELARLNNLSNPDYILVGQEIKLPNSAFGQTRHFIPQHSPPMRTLPLKDRPATMTPARAFFFVIADEFNPFRKKYVRKVFFPETLEGNSELVQKILNPEKYGFHPRNPGSRVSLGRHVLGATESKYISVSELPNGSPRFNSKEAQLAETFWIDAAKLKKAGIRVHNMEDIVKDLERIAAKTKDPKFLDYIEEIKKYSTNIDKEVVVEGSIPPKFIKGAKSRAITRGLRFVEGVGIILTAYDVGSAAYTSYEKGTPRPLAAATVRQVGGWGAAVAGFKLGAATGGLFGIETGPGALIFAGVGGFIGGAAGYFGADWIANYIYNEDET